MLAKGPKRFGRLLCTAKFADRMKSEAEKRGKDDGIRKRLLTVAAELDAYSKYYHCV